RISATIRTARSRSSGGYLLDEPPDMTPSFPRTGVSGHAGAVHDAVYNAVRNAGRAIENEQAALDHKLAEVRKRRMDTWDESYFR
ncbi:hypothetical protein ACNJLN_05710, partial [Mycobacterium tuberculosis]